MQANGVVNRCVSCADSGVLYRQVLAGVDVPLVVRVQDVRSLDAHLVVKPRVAPTLELVRPTSVDVHVSNCVHPHGISTKGRLQFPVTRSCPSPHDLRPLRPILHLGQKYLGRVDDLAEWKLEE